MTRLTQLVGTHFNHACALLIVFTMVGAWRVLRGVRSSVLSQVVLFGWLAIMLLVTYLVPPMGNWALGLVVPLFADNHLHGWFAETLGPDAPFRNVRESLRKAGPVRYVVVAAIQHLLHAGLALAIITVSGSRNSWTYWLGYGVLASAGLGIAAHILIAHRYRAEWSRVGSEAA